MRGVSQFLSGFTLVMIFVAAGNASAQSNSSDAVDAGKRAADEAVLAAELIQNGDFEASSPNGLTNDYPGWSFIAEGGAAGGISLETDSPLAGRTPHSLRLSVTKHQQRAAVANSGHPGMNIVAGDWYDLTLHARTQTNKHFGLVISLESKDGQKVCARATLPEVGGEWKDYTLALQARESDPKARLVIAMPEPGTIWFDRISLVPRKALHRSAAKPE